MYSVTENDVLLLGPPREGGQPFDQVRRLHHLPLPELTSGEIDVDAREAVPVVKTLM
jgi:hypothetical protein